MLKAVSWRLQRGEHWSFTGRNGSGKSTLLRVIAGTQWIDPAGGSRVYSFDGTSELGAMRAMPRIGYVAPEQQEHYSRLNLPMRARAIVESGFDDTIYVHRPIAATEAEDVDTIMTRFGLDAFVARRVNELSTGQLRRLLIARAIVRRPALLVLDEFTNGLDREARADVLALLEQIAPFVPLVIASHRAGDAIAAITHHATMRGGRIADAGRRRPPPVQRPDTTPPSPASAEPTDAPIVSIENASVYRGETLVLENVTWSIGAGEHTAVFGKNGTGKSTFARLVAGTLYPLDGARIRRFGHDAPFNLWQLKERVVHVSDELQVDYKAADSVLDVVLSGFVSSVGLWHHPTPEQFAAADRVLSRLELEDLRDRSFLRLSFGERRKVLIARALIRAPALLILDEVWNGLDVEFRILLEARVRELAAEGTTLLLIAHRSEDLPELIARRFTIENHHILAVR